VNEISVKRVEELAAGMSSDYLLQLEASHRLYRRQLIENLIAEQDILLALGVEIKKRGLTPRESVFDGRKEG
jgi:hypothetical protein